MSWSVFSAPPGLFAVFALLVLLGLIFCRVFLGFCSLAQFFSASGDIDEERLSGERSGERLMNVNISNPILSQSERKYDRCLSLYRLTSIFFQVCTFVQNHRNKKGFIVLEKVYRHCYNMSALERIVVLTYSLKQAHAWWSVNKIHCYKYRRYWVT